MAISPEDIEGIAKSENVNFDANCDMNDDSKQQLNTCLKELALQAQEYSKTSKQRREALTRANFKAIEKKRHSGMSWKEIPAEWGIGIYSLHIFFQRCMKKFTPI
ncbi:hypothetical protein [Calothrix rhizosoleniae]|uniref:hypothetical protein n=1 Tax=Calothrix rhizosoleniae TaxID=888997 RepID=UPI000B498589|nr:hypothetical protein [Calothrix rhizosoleniae]